MNTDFPEYETSNKTIEPNLREVVLVVDDENFDALQTLANNANATSTFDFLSIEVIWMKCQHCEWKSVNVRVVSFCPTCGMDDALVKYPTDLERKALDATRPTYTYPQSYAQPVDNYSQPVDKPVDNYSKSQP